MRAVKGQKGIAILCVAAAFCLFTRLTWADGEDQNLSTSQSQISPSGEDLGTGNFSRFPFHVSASVRGGYDDNVGTTHTNEQASWFTNGAVQLTYDFGSPRTQLSLQTGAGATYYWDNIHVIGLPSQDYDVNAYLGLTLKHKASPRLTFDLTTYLAYQTEPDFALALGLYHRTGNYFYTQDKFTTTYLWSPRFATATSYTLAALHYDSDSIGLFEDRWENTFGNEFKFLLWPTTALVAEYRFELINYMHEGNVIGMPVVLPGGRIVTPTLNFDSMTHYILGGFDHSFSPRFSASFRGGAEFRDYYDASTDEHRNSPYFEGTLNYAIGKTTSVVWTNRYEIEEPEILVNQARKTFRTGLQVTHDLTPRVTGKLGAYYEHDDYQSATTVGAFSPGFTQQAFDVALSLRFAVTRNFGVEAGYNFTDVWSDITLQEYSRNRYWAGLNVIF